MTIEIGDYKPEDYIRLSDKGRKGGLIEFFGKRFIVDEAPQHSTGLIYYLQETYQGSGDYRIRLSFCNEDKDIIRQISFAGIPEDPSSPKPEDFEPQSRVDLEWTRVTYTNPVTNEHTIDQTLSVKKEWEYKGITGEKAKKDVRVTFGAKTQADFTGRDTGDPIETRDYRPLINIVRNFVTSSGKHDETNYHEVERDGIRPNYIEVRKKVVAGDLIFVYGLDVDSIVTRYEGEEIGGNVIFDEARLIKLSPPGVTEVTYRSRSGTMEECPVPEDLGPPAPFKF